ncbi:hypothetical protein Tco_0942079 [Tanacetum coccineum]
MINTPYPEKTNTPYWRYRRMDDPNITMEEYIRLEEEKGQKRGKVFTKETIKVCFNDSLTSDETLSCEPTVSSLNDEIDFRILFDDSDDEDYTVVFDKNSFSYKIISTNDLKTDSENDNEKVNMPFFPSLEPTGDETSFYEYDEKVKKTKTSDGLAAIQAQLNDLRREIKKVNEKVYVAQVGCEQCKGPHYTKDCPLKEEGKTLEEAYYTQFGRPFQGGGYRAATSGFYQRNNANPLYQERRQYMEDTMSKFMSESAKGHEENSNLIK